MPVAAPNRLDPAPFRAWVARKLGARGPKDALGELADSIEAHELARDLGLEERQLFRWRFENQTLDRLAVEEALHRVDVGIWEVYLDLPEPQADSKPFGPQPGAGCKLSDEQLRVLHRLHIEREFSVRELGRQIYRQVGYVSADAAVFGIRNGFRRLGLEVTWRHPSKLATSPRCTFEKRDGERCIAHPLRGEEFCWPHHPDNREEAARRADRVRPLRIYIKAAA